MKKLKVFLLGHYKSFAQTDLLWSILTKLAKVECVDGLGKADLVVQGVFPFSGDMTLKAALVRRFKRSNSSEHPSVNVKSLRSRLDPDRQKVWLHYSCEAPNWHPTASFLNSECDFGVGSEASLDSRYLRMPFWYQSLDWSASGFSRGAEAFYRLGSPIKFSEILEGIPAGTFRKKNGRCALVASHLTAPRDRLAKQFGDHVPLDIFGIQGGGPYQFRSLTEKRKMLKHYTFVLAPENTLYPGYITEKVPEAYVCGAYPIGWYLNGKEPDFEGNAHLNLASLEGTGLHNMGVWEEYLERVHVGLVNEGLPPLVREPPNLDRTISFLESVLIQAVVAS